MEYPPLEAGADVVAETAEEVPESKLARKRGGEEWGD